MPKTGKGGQAKNNELPRTLQESPAKAPRPVLGRPTIRLRPLAASAVHR